MNGWGDIIAAICFVILFCVTLGSLLAIWLLVP